MAVNTNKRIPVKWVRDAAKSAYDKKDCCYICDATTELELHHTHGMTNLLEKWARDNKIDISTDEAILEVRERFIEEHHREIYDEVFTLCAKHHKNLHLIFGKSPALSTAQKQAVWIAKQKDKHNGIQSNELVQERQPSTRTDSTIRGEFGRLICNTNSFSSLRTT